MRCLPRSLIEPVTGAEPEPYLAITNTATVTGNSGGVEFNNNTVTGGLTITGNTGTLPPPDTGSVHVVGNTVLGPRNVQP